MLKYRYKLNSILSRVKNLFSRQFHYSYSSHSMRYKFQGIFAGNKKQFWMASLVIAMIFSLYMVSSAVTGYITYGNIMEIEYNKTRDLLLLKQSELEDLKTSEESCYANLFTTEDKLNTCNDKFSKSESYLVECEKDRDNLKLYSGELNSLLETCEIERADFSEKYENASTTLNNMIDSTVRLICCRPGIDVSEWDMEQGEIICSGPFSVDCTTGEVSY